MYYPVFPCIFTEEIMAAEIAKVAEIHYFRQQNIYGGTLSMSAFLFDNLFMLAQSLWSKGPIAWTCNFNQMHLVIKDDNSFQSLLLGYSRKNPDRGVEDMESPGVK